LLIEQGDSSKGSSGASAKKIVIPTVEESKRLKALAEAVPQGEAVPAPTITPAPAQTISPAPAQTISPAPAPVIAPQFNGLVGAETVATVVPPQPETPAEPELEWTDLGLSQEALDLIEKSGFKRPTGIQSKAIPLALAGKDLIASSQTGTGKTASFVLPMVEKLAGRNGTYGLILAPTREIAQQIQGTLKLLAEPRGLRSAVLIGGIDMRYDQEALNSYPQIIVATPGRLCDHIERGNVWLEYIEFLILDEADRMLDMGFSEQLNKIVAETPTNRQTLLFSATFAAPVEKLAKKILTNPERIAMGRITAAKTVTQRLVFLRDEDGKNRELRAQLREEKGSVIVFTRTKDQATQVYRMLHAANFYDVTYIHSDRLQSHREQALADFKSGKYRILIATDVAGRGIHVDDVAHVINYDLPMEAEDYIHRVGRTGRAEATGVATSFATRKDREILASIEKLIKGKIPEIQPLSAPAGRRESQDKVSGEAVSLEKNSTPVSSEKPARIAPSAGKTQVGTSKSAPKKATQTPSQNAASVRPSQRPGPIRAIDLLPPAEYYDGDVGLDWGWLPPQEDRRLGGGDVGHNYHAGDFRPVVNKAEILDSREESPSTDEGTESSSSGEQNRKRNRRGGRRRNRKHRSGPSNPGVSPGSASSGPSSQS